MGLAGDERLRYNLLGGEAQIEWCHQLGQRADCPGTVIIMLIHHSSPRTIEGKRVS